ncbi:MAG: FG-GAP-like repeat-containing protein [Bacteroidota bacterium]
MPANPLNQFHLKSIRALILTLLLFSISGKNATGQSFQSIPTTVEPMTSSHAQWADLNNDQLPDLIVVGKNNTDISKVIAHYNNGDSTFSELEIARLSQTAFDVGDFNKDGYLDLLVSGKTNLNDKILRVYKNNAGTSYTDQSLELVGLTNGDVLWVDLDHDMDLDIIASGLDALGEENIWVYVWDGTNYRLITHSLEPVSYGNLVAFDANKDGNKEVLVTGYNDLGNPTATVYSFDSNLNTSVYSETLDGYAQHAIDLADINEDGFVDIVMSGITENFSKATNIYFNNQVNGFYRFDQSLDSIGNAALDLGDVNNDGLIDLVLMGFDEDGNTTAKYYVNAGYAEAYHFTETPHPFESLHSGGISLADFNGDGDLDIFQTGNAIGSLQAKLFASEQHLSISNAIPTTPSGLTSNISAGEITLEWEPTSDDFTHFKSLSYNVYVSSNPNGTNLLLSPGSNISTGFRSLTEFDNAEFSTQLIIPRLPEGRYYWSVQAIDNGFKGSLFADEAEFVVCDPINLGEDLAICQQESISLAIGEAGDIVNWYSLKDNNLVASNTLTYHHIANQKDTIVAELTKNVLGCVLYDTIIVDVIEPIELALGSEIILCVGDSLEILLTEFDSVNWYTFSRGLISNEKFLKLFIEAKDTLVLEGFHDGCIQYDTVVIDFYPDTKIELMSEISKCQGDTLALQIDGFEVINWHSETQGLLASDSKSLKFLVLSTDKIIAEGITDSGCHSYDTLQVNVLELPQINLGGDTLVCFGERIEFSPEGFEEVSWHSQVFGDFFTVTDFQYAYFEEDTLVVEVTNDEACRNFDTLIINIAPLPEIDLGPDKTICLGESLLIKPQDPDYESITWFSISSTTAIEEDQWFLDYHPASTDTIIAKATSTFGCVNWDTLIVTVNPVPEINLMDTAVCIGDKLVLSMEGDWSEVNWYTFDNQILQLNQHRYEFIVEEPIVLWVEVINAFGCITYDTIAVGTRALPTFNFEESLQFCRGDQINISVDDIGTEYMWWNQSMDIISGDRSLNMQSVEDDQIHLKVTNAEGCSYLDSVDIIVNDLPPVEILGNDHICDNELTELRIEVEDDVEIIWSIGLDRIIGEEAANLNIYLDNSNYIYSSVHDQNGCINQDSIFILVDPSPIARAGVDQFTCYGEEVMIGDPSQSSENLFFQWTPDPSLSNPEIANPMVYPLSSKHFILSVINEFGCTDLDSVYVRVNPEFVGDAGPDQTLCIGDQLTIGGNPTAIGNSLDYQYSWFPSTGLSSPDVSNPIVTLESDQTYILTVESGDCASEPDSVHVIVRESPNVEAGITTSIGTGQPVMLQASGGINYHWEPSGLLDNPNIPNPLANPISSTVFTVEGTDEYGCSMIDSVWVMVQNVVFIPNLFSPNGDGSNDQFKIYGSGIKEVQFSIFDLSGNLLYNTRDTKGMLNHGWDGTFNGQLLNNGSYIWTLSGQFFDGSPLNFNGKNKGIIKLLR